MKILFLDIDGVLNGHEKLPGSVYCGIRPERMAELNRVVAATNCRIVLSSAWRYQILNGATTIKGFNYLMYTHGLLPVGDFGPIIGRLFEDERSSCREGTIQDWIKWYSWDSEAWPWRQMKQWAVVDDLDLTLPAEDAWRFVRTRGDVGLTALEADRLVSILNDGKSGLI